MVPIQAINYFTNLNELRLLETGNAALVLTFSRLFAINYIQQTLLPEK